jgi:hypothetical protein
VCPQSYKYVSGTFELNGPPDLGVLELGEVPPHYGPRPQSLFADGFETGDTSAWSAAVP